MIFCNNYFKAGESPCWVYFGELSSPIQGRYLCRAVSQMLFVGTTALPSPPTTPECLLPGSGPRILSQHSLLILLKALGSFERIPSIHATADYCTPMGAGADASRYSMPRHSIVGAVLLRWLIGCMVPQLLPLEDIVSPSGRILVVLGGFLKTQKNASNILHIHRIMHRRGGE